MVWNNGVELTDGQFLEIMDVSVSISHFDSAWFQSLTNPGAVLLVGAIELEMNEEVFSSDDSSLTPAG
jgi:hypothetical protein